MSWAAIVRLTLGFILALAAVAKSRDAREVAGSVDAYGLVPRAFAPVVGFAVLIAEYALSLSLLLGIEPATTLRLASALMLLFVLASWRALIRSDEPIDCGCLGSFVVIRENWILVALNGMLALLAVAASFEPAVLSVSGGHSLPTSAAMSLVLVASLLAIVYWVGAYAWSVHAKVNRTLASRTVR